MGAASTLREAGKKAKDAVAKLPVFIKTLGAKDVNYPTGEDLSKAALAIKRLYELSHLLQS
jgi:hypothetical protein